MTSQGLAEKIRAARSLGARPHERRFTAFSSVGELLAHRAAEFPSAPFLDYYPDRESPVRLSYFGVHTAVERVAGYLIAEGIRRGDRVATLAHNDAGTVLQYLACWTIGAVVVPVNMGEDDKRIGYILANSRAKLAFVMPEYKERAAGIFSQMASPPAVAADDPTSRPRLSDAPGPDDEALIVYTSGTTGNPKGVVLTHYNLLADAMAIAGWHGVRQDTRMMCVLPIHHVNGIVVTLLTPLFAGGSVVLNRKFSTEIFFQRIREEKVQIVSVVPTLLQFLLASRSGPFVRPPALRHIICGAGPLTCELARSFETAFGIRIVHGYGLSETTCYSCFLPADLTDDEHASWMYDHGFPSIGVPIPANEMEIHDMSGIPLGPGVRGEIVARGHNVMKEYYADDGANESAFAHSWFRSGDEGFYREDERGRKYFFITGRIKELIIRGGTNISPFEIDEVLMNLPGVAAGLAVGFDNDWYGEEVGAYVRRAPGSTVSAEEILAQCRKIFPFQKSPKVVVFGEEVPVTSTGKYQRNKLKPLFAEWKTVQFREER